MVEIAQTLERIERRLIALEEKVDRIQVLPRAVKLTVAAKLLGCDVKTIKKDVARRKLRTVLVGDREHVPVAEIVRLCAVPSLPALSPLSIPPRRRQKKAEAKSAAERFRELAKRRD